VLDRVIIDKNARIGDGARLVNERGSSTRMATATTSAAASSSSPRAE
jgi:ADP-glucose pyrophosphorylase